MVISEACVPSDLYSYIYHFLITNDLNKTAKSLKKETRLNFLTSTTPTLVEVFNDFLSRRKQSVIDMVDLGDQNEKKNDELPLENINNNNMINDKEKKSNKKHKRKRKLEENVGSEVVEKKIKNIEQVLVVDDEISNHKEEEKHSKNKKKKKKGGLIFCFCVVRKAR